MKEFWKSVNIWWSWGLQKMVPVLLCHFWTTLYILVLVFVHISSVCRFCFCFYGPCSQFYEWNFSTEIATEGCYKNARAEKWLTNKQLFECFYDHWRHKKSSSYEMLYERTICPSVLSTHVCRRLLKFWTGLATGFWGRSFQLSCSVFRSPRYSTTSVTVWLSFVVQTAVYLLVIFHLLRFPSSRLLTTDGCWENATGEK